MPIAAPSDSVKDVVVPPGQPQSRAVQRSHRGVGSWFGTADGPPIMRERRELPIGVTGDVVVMPFRQRRVATMS